MGGTAQSNTSSSEKSPLKLNIRQSGGSRPVGVGKNLSVTNQTYHPMLNLNNPNSTKIFDHPQDVASKGILNQQGSTCGLCASGTVANICGNNFTENVMFAHAKAKGLCSNDGGTTPAGRSQLITSMTGVPTDVVHVKNLEDLVPYVESGKGVIIPVEASIYKSDWYGNYNPQEPKGHAIVLASVVRDAKTNEIIKYVVIDSNGRTPSEACQHVDPKVLQTAFRVRGGAANVTKNIIY
ncbi:MAG: hypothetical protein K6A37_04310 [Saccharofermentans sp.]|nr:hypothetical protein [Saccharofermentans sp.]